MRTHAFGLDIQAGFELPGFVEGPAGHGARRVDLDLAPASELDARWAGAQPERVVEIEGAGGGPAILIDAAGGLGFHHWAEDFGRAWIAADGGEVLVAPVSAPAWRWQRYLTGQVLPFVAVLQGLEAFHASAVIVDGRAIVIVSHSGFGKTSLALNMALEGAAFLADDVALVEASGDRLVVHPGVGLANVRHGPEDLASRVESQGLGKSLGRTESETRVALTVPDAPVPLGAMFLLDRASSGTTALVEPLSSVDPRLLLTATFNHVVRDPARLVRQLDVCAEIARSAALFKVEYPPGVGAAALAGEVLAAARELEPA